MLKILTLEENKEDMLNAIKSFLEKNDFKMSCVEELMNNGQGHMYIYEKDSSNRKFAILRFENNFELFERGIDWDSEFPIIFEMEKNIINKDEYVLVEESKFRRVYVDKSIELPEGQTKKS